MDKDIAIKVEGVSKTFKIPHEKISSLRGAAVTAFKKKTYEEFKALDDVSFEVKKGEFFGIIGRNGSGKSTLLKILARIYQPDKGKVKINGMISPFLELGIGFNPELSGRDNVYLNATVLGLTKKEIDEKFDSIVKFSELERFIDQKLKNYSSGMQVRLAFAVSIHANRDILLMDEVLAVGDANFQAKCLREFRRYKEMGKTVILVSHDIATVEKYCDRAMLIKSGNILKIGKTNEVINEYVLENIFDNEKNVNKETVGSDNKAKIKKVRLLGEDFREKIVFRATDVMNIEIEYEAKEGIKNLNLGVGMHSNSWGFVFGYNTQMDQFEIKNNSGKITLTLKNLPLLKGSYFINFTLYGDMVEELYDFVPNGGNFQIISQENSNHYNGLVFIEHTWDNE